MGSNSATVTINKHEIIIMPKKNIYILEVTATTYIVHEHAFSIMHSTEGYRYGYMRITITYNNYRNNENSLWMDNMFGVRLTDALTGHPQGKSLLTFSLRM